MDMAVGFSSSTTKQNQIQPENAFVELAPYSAPKSAKPWQIFINHYGGDVKHTLATTIYQKLNSMGFYVFLDKDSLEPGDSFPGEIQHAIASASLHIAIFSPNYPQSPWCLAELISMLKTRKKIIPIFYHVDPSDLRWIKEGKGWYAHVLSEHKKKGRYKPEQLDEWKGALHECSFLHGYPLNNEKDEATVLKNIVKCALKILNTASLWVGDHPLGLDELVQDFESLAREEGVKIWGIVGMGGSGKTTLAKEFFNRNFSSFERCSFVSDVFDAASKNALPDKQKKLLEDLGIDDLQFHHVDEGQAVLANRLSSHRALIILDDVDHIDQLNALLPNKDKLGSQSIVIVTTRDTFLLQSFGIGNSCIFRMPGLSTPHAQQLFCWHAFLQPSPPAEFETLVRDFLRVCNGLPLSLKVLGAHLYGRKSRDYWKSQLHNILRLLPSKINQTLQVSYDALDEEEREMFLPREFKQTLRISYDTLDEEEREMFLDVACFFIGEEISKAIAVWDRLGWSGRRGFRSLLDKCLVDVVEGERITMHDQVRDMGREIATRHSPYRLWCAEQIDKMKEHSTAEQLVQVMEEAQVELLRKGVATAAGPVRTDGQSVEDFVGEITARDSIIEGLERDTDRLQRQLAGMQQDCAKRERDMLRLQLDRDSNQSLVQEQQAQVTRLRAESQRLCLDRDIAMRLLEGQGMGHAFTQLMDVATRMDRAHRESGYYRGLYERVVPIEQREPPFAEGSLAG